VATLRNLNLTENFFSLKSCFLAIKSPRTWKSAINFFHFSRHETKTSLIFHMWQVKTTILSDLNEWMHEKIKFIDSFFPPGVPESQIWSYDKICFEFLIFNINLFDEHMNKGTYSILNHQIITKDRHPVDTYTCKHAKKPRHTYKHFPTLTSSFIFANINHVWTENMAWSTVVRIMRWSCNREVVVSNPLCLEFHFKYIFDSGSFFYSFFSVQWWNFGSFDTGMIKRQPDPRKCHKKKVAGTK
jgi:hypothetical protein